MTDRIQIVIADDERPARSFLRAMLADFEDVQIVGEAESGAEAVEIIEETKPDLALLDLQMPELTGLEVVQALGKNSLPLVAFVTAYDEYAVRAFEVNAVDYLLKPVERIRLRETINRAVDLLERQDSREQTAANVRAAAAAYEENARQPLLERIPLRRGDSIVLLPAREIASVVADGELLHLTTIENERFVFNHRLKDLEARLDPNLFVRLSRGSLVNFEMIAEINPLPGGTYLITLKNNQQLPVSRLQSRILRNQFFRL